MRSGGTLAAIESGYIQREIQDAAYEYQRAIEEAAYRRRRNKFQDPGHEALKPFRIDPELEPGQIARLRAVRASRSSADVRLLGLFRLETAARGSRKSMPLILAACRVHATVGEMSCALRRVFGDYHVNF